MSSNLRVGVIGVGYLGKFHARIYSEMSGVDLVGVADTDEKTAQRIATQYDCVAFTSGDDLLDQVDAVSVAVPTSLHRRIAEPFLQKGVHMLLEKPVAANIRDAQAIVDLANENKVLLQIGHLERFNAGLMSLSERVDNPRFIEIHRLGTFVERATDVDVVTDLMIHDIDIVLSLIPSKLVNVQAVGVPVVTNHVDIANARLEFANGAVANVTASRVSNKKFRRIRVFAENCYHALNFNDQQIEVVTTGDKSANNAFPNIISEKIKVSPQPPLDAQLVHFINAVRKGAQPLVDGNDGLEALRVAHLVKEKIQL